MRLTERKACVRCGLSAQYRFLDLDENGVCRFCRDYQKPVFPGARQLLQELDLQADEKIGVTVSGGKDSLYMWSVLTDLLGPQHILALYYYRPGIASPTAVENIEKAKRELSTELVIQTDREAYPRFRKNLRILLEDPRPEAVRVLLCAGCRYGITGLLHLEGMKKGVTKYFSAASYLELAPFKEELIMANSEAGDMDDGFEKILSAYPGADYQDNLFNIRRDHRYKYKNTGGCGHRIPVRDGIRLFDFDRYFENDPERIEQIVTEKLGWKKTDRSWHFDCIIEDFKDVFYYGMLGYTEMDFYTAAMVRNGFLSLEQASEVLGEHNKRIVKGYSRMAGSLTAHQLEDLRPLIMRFYSLSPYLEDPGDSGCGRLSGGKPF